MSEKQIEASSCAWAKKNGWYVRKFSSPAHRGVPDRIFIKNGRVVFIEFKAPGKKPTILQQHEIDVLLANGVEATWSDSVERTKAILG